MSIIKKNYLTLFFSVFLFLTLAITGTGICLAEDKPDPTQQLKPFLDKVITILSKGEAEEASPCDLCQSVIDVARERFDFEEMSKRVLGRHWKPLSDVQRAEFTDLFTRLLEHAYIGKIQEYVGQEIEYKKQRIRGNRAEVQTLLVDAGRTIPISYIMILKGQEWMAYDVIVEGVSLVRNYKEQFDQIVSSDGYDVLVQEIEKKIAQIEQEKTGGE